MNGLLSRLKQNPVARNSLFLGLAAGCRGVAEVAVVIMAVRALDTAQAGQVIVGFAIVRIAQYVTEGGLGMYLAREIPRKPEATTAYTLGALKLVLIIAIPAALVFALATAAIDAGLALLVGLGAAAVVFGAAQPIISGAFLGHNEAEWQFVPMLVLAVVQIVCGLLVALFAPSLVAFFLTIALSRAAGFGATFWAFIRRFGLGVHDHEEISVRRVFVSGLPYSVNAVASYVYLRVDILLVGAIAGSASAGIYGSVADPLVTLTALVYIVTRAFLPNLSSAHGTSPERFKRLTQNMLLVNFVFGVVAAVIVFFGSGVFVSRAFGEDLAPAAGVLRVLSMAIALRFVHSGLATWLTAAGRQWQRTVVIISGAFLNVVMNLVAIPLWGYVAAAWTTVATETALLAIFILLLRREIAGWLRITRELDGPARAASAGGDVGSD